VVVKAQRMRAQAADTANFSTASFILILYIRFSSELTFENGLNREISVWQYKRCEYAHDACTQLHSQKVSINKFTRRVHSMREHF